MVKEGNGGIFSETLSACLLRVTQFLILPPCHAEKKKREDSERIHEEQSDEPTFLSHSCRSPHSPSFQCDIQEEEENEIGDDGAKVVDGANELHVVDEVLEVHVSEGKWWLAMSEPRALRVFSGQAPSRGESNGGRYWIRTSDLANVSRTL